MTASPPDGAPPGPDDASPAEANATGIRRFGALFGAVVAPTSFVTALLYYFGWHHAYWFFDYFGINATTLGFSTVDYLMRSLDALFVPMAVMAGTGLIAFWGHDLLRQRIAEGRRPQLLRIAVPVTAGVGFLCALGGFWSILAPTFLTPHLALAPLTLASGVILLAYALHLRRALVLAPDGVVPPRTASGTTPGPPPDAPPDATSDTTPSPASPASSPRPSTAPETNRVRPDWAPVAEWGAILVLVGLSLLWAANDYAASVGHGRAARLAAHLAGQPSVVLYSQRDLALDEPGVRELRCGDGKATYGHRYEGLVLVIQSANQYVLVSKAWTSATGSAIVLPRSDAVRLEFVPAGAWRPLGHC
ncbi:hypothetical protein ACFYWS_32835 [Streptomyces sp. NPDC002795]|uniref:hypothetical protein n=1 Tax=Streptomyces sp. NPDC002795 TaxID=3364665 RepID=UPI0036C53E81